MNAEVVDLNITKGSSFNVRIQVLDDNSNVIDLTGYELRGVVKNKYSDDNILINLDPVVYDATNGLVDILLSDIQTSQLPITEALYDIEKFPISGTGETDKVMKGRFLIHPEITSKDDAYYGGINPTTTTTTTTTAAPMLYWQGDDCYALGTQYVIFKSTYTGWENGKYYKAIQTSGGFECIDGSTITPYGGTTAAYEYTHPDEHSDCNTCEGI